MNPWLSRRQTNSLCKVDATARQNQRKRAGLLSKHFSDFEGYRCEQATRRVLMGTDLTAILDFSTK